MLGYDLGIRIIDNMLILVCSMMILVVILSATGDKWIANQESRTGGMGESGRCR
jgi:hypothetical protein